MPAFLPDIYANAAAQSAGYPADALRASIPSSGVFVVYNNARYRIDVRNGKYLAQNISVYDSDGSLLTDTFDVYVNAVIDGFLDSARASLELLGKVGEGATGALDLIANLKWLLIGGAILYIIADRKYGKAF